MDVILSHTSALDAYRLDLGGLHSRAFGENGSPRKTISPDYRGSFCQDDAAYLENYLGLTLPIHIFKPQGHHQYKKLLACHTVKNTFPGSLSIAINKGLNVASPEFLFLQMSTLLEFPELVALGFELCGHYALPAPGRTETEYNMSPLTSCELLRSYSDLAKGQAGAVSMRTALPYIQDNSRSPMETNAAMLLGLPCKRGGKGLGMPFMNYRVELDEHARKLTHKKYLECDLFYPQSGLDIEYESTQFHGQVCTEKNRQDSIRREALQHVGITVMTLTDAQVFNVEMFDLFANDVAKQMGKRIRPMCKEYPDKCYRLREALLGAS